MKEETQPKDLKRSVVTLETQSTSGYRKSSKNLTEQAVRAGCWVYKVEGNFISWTFSPFSSLHLVLSASKLIADSGRIRITCRNHFKEYKKKLSKISQHAWVTSMKEYLSIVLCLVRLHYVTIFLSLYHLTTLQDLFSVYQQFEFVETWHIDWGCLR